MTHFVQIYTEIVCGKMRMLIAFMRNMWRTEQHIIWTWICWQVGEFGKQWQISVCCTLTLKRRAWLMDCRDAVNPPSVPSETDWEKMCPWSPLNAQEQVTPKTDAGLRNGRRTVLLWDPQVVYQAMITSPACITYTQKPHLKTGVLKHMAQSC